MSMEEFANSERNISNWIRFSEDGKRSQPKTSSCQTMLAIANSSLCAQAFSSRWDLALPGPLPKQHWCLTSTGVLPLKFSSGFGFTDSLKSLGAKPALLALIRPRKVETTSKTRDGEWSNAGSLYRYQDGNGLPPPGYLHRLPFFCVVDEPGKMGAGLCNGKAGWCHERPLMYKMMYILCLKLYCGKCLFIDLLDCLLWVPS